MKVTDANGNPVSGVSVVFTVTGGGGAIVPASPATVITTASGLAQVTSWTLGSTAGTNTLTATSGTLTGSPVTFTATGTAGAVSATLSTVTASPNPITAGSTGSTITVTAKDANGNPVSGATVVLAANPNTGNGNTLTQPVGTTNSLGQITGTLASTVAETKTVSATINSVLMNQTVSVVVYPAGVSNSLSTVTATSPQRRRHPQHGHGDGQGRLRQPDQRRDREPRLTGTGNTVDAAGRDATASA